MSDGLRVLVVDNFDSFTYNLVEYVGERADTEVVRNTATLADVCGTDPDAIVVSPGPGHPENDRDVGVTLDVFREVSPEVPTLGVCLGLEAAVYAYGGSVSRAPEPVHGKADPVFHDGRGVYAGVDQGFRAGRYHSLVATEVPEEFAVTASTDPEWSGADPIGGPPAGPNGSDGDEGLVMGVRHVEHPIECVQFHPESVLTGVGRDVVDNFLDLAG